MKGNGDVTVTNCYKTTMAGRNDSQAKNGQNAKRQRRAATDMQTDDEEDYDLDDLKAYGIWANVYDVMPSYFGQLVTDYGFLKVYDGGLEYEDEYYVASISLADNDYNNELIGYADGYIVDMTLASHTFRKDGEWQTIFLPFGLSELEGSPLEGAMVMTLGNSEACKTGFNAATGTLTLDFVDADMIEAGVAYIVKWDKPEGYDGYESDFDITAPMFRGVTVANESPEDHASVSRDGYVQFVGTYSPADIYTVDKTNLCIGTGDTLYYPWGDGMTSYNVSACTAYFQLLNGLTAGESSDMSAPRVSNFVLDFGKGTGILAPGSSSEGKESGDWHTLGGVKLGEKPSAKGIYINAGRKVVIK